jgi:hypothetical protein
MRDEGVRAITLFVLISGFLISYICPSGQCGTQGAIADPKPAKSKELAQIEEKWGIEVTNIRLSAHGSMVDFRYRILDPEKAKSLTDRNARPYLIDEASGEKSYVPNAPKMGSLRAKGNPITGRTYFILFSNPKGTVKEGNNVTVVIGDFKAEGLTVK